VRRRAARDVREIPFLVWDLEALGWDRFAVAASMGEDGEPRVHETRGGLADHLRAQSARAIAHYGGHYDFYFLPPLQQIVMSGSGILKARLGRAVLYDSWYKFQMPLAKIGRATGVRKLEGRSDRMEELTPAEREEQCVQDCRVLLSGELAHREWVAAFEHPEPRWPPTAGSTAVYLMESLEPHHAAYLGRQVLSLEEWTAQSAAPSGGRVEVHRIGEVAGPLLALDLNSSYPYSWLEAPLPVGPWVAVSEEVPHLPGVYLCEVAQPRGSYPLVAPDSGAGPRWQFDGRAWATSEEIAALREAGGAARVVCGWVSRAAGPLGQAFVAEMYERKLRGDPWAKVSINSLHGKLLQLLLQTTFYRLRDGRYAADRDLAFPGWYQRPLIGAFVLARARIRLWRAMEALRRAGWRVWYTDTDSIHTDCPRDRLPAEIRLGEACGWWKVERECSRALYVAPKVYALESTPEWHARELERDPAARRVKIVCKGFPVRRLTWEHLARAAAGEEVVVQETAGLESFRSFSGDWDARARTIRRTLAAHTGGKVYVGTSGDLDYRDRGGRRGARG
jgi:hypothetical protein